MVIDLQHAFHVSIFQSLFGISEIKVNRGCQNSSDEWPHDHSQAHIDCIDRIIELSILELVLEQALHKPNSWVERPSTQVSSKLNAQIERHWHCNSIERLFCGCIVGHGEAATYEHKCSKNLNHQDVPIVWISWLINERFVRSNSGDRTEDFSLIVLIGHDDCSEPDPEDSDDRPNDLTKPDHECENDIFPIDSLHNQHSRSHCWVDVGITNWPNQKTIGKLSQSWGTTTRCYSVVYCHWQNKCSYDFSDADSSFVLFTTWDFHGLCLTYLFFLND